MEFEEMKKIWDVQNGETLYAINEQALHNRILAKKKTTAHITNTSELLLIAVNIAAGSFILLTNIGRSSATIFMNVLAAWMLASAAYVLFIRTKRQRKQGVFDRSVLGDLNQAISTATYQVHLSFLGRWNILPVVLLTLLSIWDSGKSIWLMTGVFVFFILVSFASNWEHSLYKTRKRELEQLKKKLEGEI